MEILQADMSHDLGRVSFRLKAFPLEYWTTYIRINVVVYIIVHYVALPPILRTVLTSRLELRSCSKKWKTILVEVDNTQCTLTPQHFDCAPSHRPQLLSYHFYHHKLEAGRFFTNVGFQERSHEQEFRIRSFNNAFPSQSLPAFNQAHIVSLI